jgi:hypothetical protein
MRAIGRVLVGPVALKLTGAAARDGAAYEDGHLNSAILLPPNIRLFYAQGNAPAVEYKTEERQARGPVNAVELIKKIAVIGDGAVWCFAGTWRRNMQQNLPVNFDGLHKGGNSATVVSAFGVSLSFRLL